jgi:NTP pyrophosphatase (non-canonical NTP hydrolase)
MVRTMADVHPITPTFDLEILPEGPALFNSVNLLKHAIHAKNKEAGWWTDLNTGEPLQRNVGELLMLMVSELAEAMEGHRKNLQDDKLPHRKMIEVELADCLIRIYDAAGGLKLDLAGALVEKLAYNQTRKDHKPEERMKAEGKKY